MKVKREYFKISQIFIIVVSLGVIPGEAGAKASVDSGFAHLEEVMDKYHKSFDVYTDLSAAGNHFVALGRIFSAGGQDKVEINPGCNVNPLSGETCVENRFSSNVDNWGGWYFLNGVLEGEERKPKLNWGEYPDAGINLSGASRITFWAKGATGGERVEFFAFGVGRNASTGNPTNLYPDSSRKRSTGYLTLTNSWQQYAIDLSGANLTYVVGGFGWVTSADRNSGNIVFYLDEIKYEKPYLDQPRFLVSYETIPSSLDFDLVMKNIAFTYDNALALTAFLASGKPEHLQRAQLLADALVYAVGHDRFFSDGRLRNAYQGGDLYLAPGWVPNGKTGTVRMPGWWDATAENWLEDKLTVSSRTGDLAWAILALVSFYEKAGGNQYLDAAKSIGEFIEAHTRDTKGAGGYTGGYEGWEMTTNNPDGQKKYTWKSTEHNIDLFVAFSRLGKATGNPGWKARASYARTFVDAMWNQEGGHFWTGTLDDGVSINTAAIPADVNAWGLLALGNPSLHKPGITWVENNCYVEEDGLRGFDFNNDKDHIWLEGTAHMALAYQLLGDQNKASDFLSELEKAQTNATNNNGKGIVSALHDGLTTGFDWEYFNRLHVGATAWFLFAETAYNPYWGTRIVKGDINGDGESNLSDAILALQVVAGQSPSGIRSDYQYSGADVDGDNMAGTQEALFILGSILGLR